MGDFTIQISRDLVNRLADDVDLSKKKTRRTKCKTPREPRQPQRSESQMLPPLYLPAAAPVQSANAGFAAIQSVLGDSEKVVKRLQKQEETMLQEVTQKAQNLHDKEYKLPNPKPVPCKAERDASLACYKEHVKDPLTCASLVTGFADCVRRFRQQVS